MPQRHMNEINKDKAKMPEMENKGLLLADRLKAGDTIGVVSPSTPVTGKLEERFQAGIRYLEALGFRVRIGEHVRAGSLEDGPRPKQKAADLNAMFRDSEIKAVICSQGGDSAEQVLPYLDWDCIRQNPKILMGFSDITVLLNAVNRATGLVTFHGNDVVWGWGRHPQEYDRRAFITRLVDGEMGVIPPYRARSTVRSGSAEGRLLGGNLRCLLKLFGTPYFPDFTGAILFLEALRVTEEECARFLDQLDTAGFFDAINGVVVGYIHSMQAGGSGTSMVETLLERKTASRGFPILKVNDFGHNCPNTVLPVGGGVKMDADGQTLELNGAFLSMHADAPLN